MKIKIRTYDKSGNQDQEYFFDTIQEALGKYVECRNSILNFRNHTAIWPTIWINTNNGFIRIHDFAFSELTDKTIAMYLNERILDTDDLLATKL